MVVAQHALRTFEFGTVLGSVLPGLTLDGELPERRVIQVALSIVGLKEADDLFRRGEALIQRDLQSLAGCLRGQSACDFLVRAGGVDENRGALVGVLAERLHDLRAGKMRHEVLGCAFTLGQTVLAQLGQKRFAPLAEFGDEWFCLLVAFVGHWIPPNGVWILARDRTSRLGKTRLRRVTVQVVFSGACSIR